MASKIPVARDANNNRITISMAEQGKYQKPLTCEFCETSVGFVNAFTRNVGDVLILMPPYCSTPAQITGAVEALRLAMREILG